MVSFEINYSPHTSQFRFHQMGESPKHCRFPPSQNTHFTYVCSKNEICCENGCCITSLRRMAEFWYFWLILISVCIAFLFCMHYYNKLRIEREERRFTRRRDRVRRFVHSNEMYGDGEELEMDRRVMVDVHNPEAPRRRCVVEPFESPNGTGEINEFLLEHLIVSYQNRNAGTLFNSIVNVPPANLNPPPPDYNSVVKNEINEPPPKYCDACQHADKAEEVAEIQSEISAVQTTLAENPPEIPEDHEHEEPCHDC